MKKLLILAIVVGAALFVWKKSGGKVPGIEGPDAVENARVRVTAILDGMKKGGGGVNVEIQTSICQWYNGKILIQDRDELTKASDLFTVWVREKGLDRKIADYEIVGVEVLPGSAPPTCVVRVKIEGQTYRMKVPEKQTISWVG